MRRFILIAVEVLVVVGLIGAAYWYYIADGSVPDTSDYALDIAQWRELVREDQVQLVTEIRVEVVARDIVPFAAVQAGGAWRPYTMVRTAFQLNGPTGSVVIDSGMDAAMAKSLQRDGQSIYDEKAYDRVIAAMGNAARVAVTHEHPDHIGGVARFPVPERLAERLTLTKAQFDGLAQISAGGRVAPAFAQMPLTELTGPVRIAAGVVMIPAPGHTPGSVMFYVRTWNGREALFIGDVAWSMSNVRAPAVRPRAVQDFYMTPPEERAKVSAQIRALHELAKKEPALAIIPAHDEDQLNAVMASGLVQPKFTIDPP
jgi:glyoxylase-like metal-dependent hydrolase (beta-lactamase superfamily II)